jgi:NAD(P)-dependent dehydrogenase (short-subunit alcohol dehydrogenase family)
VKGHLQIRVLSKGELTQQIYFVDDLGISSFIDSKMSLKSQTALVLGGTGFIGYGAAFQFLKEGATVVVPSRTEARLQELLKKFPKEVESKQLIGLVGSFQTKAEVEETYKNVKKLLGGASPDHVVSSFGFASTTPKGITESDIAVLSASFDESLYPSIYAAQVILSDIREKEGSTYTVVSGGLAHFCIFPGKNVLQTLFCDGCQTNLLMMKR